jgi:hypothetical protein
LSIRCAAACPTGRAAPLRQLAHVLELATPDREVGHGAVVVRSCLLAVVVAARHCLRKSKVHLVVRRNIHFLAWFAVLYRDLGEARAYQSADRWALKPNSAPREPWPGSVLRIRPALAPWRCTPHHRWFPCPPCMGRGLFLRSERGDRRVVSRWRATLRIGDRSQSYAHTGDWRDDG